MADDYRLEFVFLQFGVVYASYSRGGRPYMAQVCDISSANPFAILTTVRAGVAAFNTNISVPFPRLVALDFTKHFLVIDKIKDMANGGSEGRRRGTLEWLPLLLTNDNILYVEDEHGKRMYVINESSRPFSSLEKAGIGFGIGVASVGLAVCAVFAAPFAIAGIGFGTGGIAAGSTAATMMSLGVVGVATLQSIGAAGMGAASIIILGGAGAAMGGGAAAAGAAYATGSRTMTHEDHQFTRVMFMENGKPLPLVLPSTLIITTEDLKQQAKATTTTTSSSSRSSSRNLDPLYHYLGRYAAPSAPPADENTGQEPQASSSRAYAPDEPPSAPPPEDP